MSQAAAGLQGTEVGALAGVEGDDLAVEHGVAGGLGERSEQIRECGTRSLPLRLVRVAVSPCTRTRAR
ncbi:hypothetical protein [Rathayibacter rathayi]|uniref:hypothetical protein n=1 Tax=Rathayibacter rathayi TaxID=33887 RepID=UPI0015E221E9|nr:hypothetical protein [Rathayibacter rathayi]